MVKPVRKKAKTADPNDPEVLVRKMQNYAQRIINIFQKKEKVDVALASTLIAAVGMARNAGATRDQFLHECLATWDNTG